MFRYTFFFVFFFQAEDGIRDTSVTGVQTLLFRSAFRARRLGPDDGVHEGGEILLEVALGEAGLANPGVDDARLFDAELDQIGRASCREGVQVSVGGWAFREREERVVVEDVRGDEY